MLAGILVGVRVSEGSGEDPFLGAEIAKCHGAWLSRRPDERNDEIMACVKHFALYGASEAGRDYNTVEYEPSTHVQ